MPLSSICPDKKMLKFMPKFTTRQFTSNIGIFPTPSRFHEYIRVYHVFMEPRTDYIYMMPVLSRYNVREEDPNRRL